jgi:hypothetical protein
MRDLKPFFFEHSRIPALLSKCAPIEIGAITLFCVVFARGALSEETKRHETIHFQQYLETLVIGFLLIYLFDYLVAAVIRGKGFTREAYLSIRFEQEAWTHDKDVDYLETRTRWAWLRYPLGGSHEST